PPARRSPHLPGPPLGRAAVRPLGLTVGVALSEIGALDRAALAARQRQLALPLAVGEVQRQRHEREPALADLADEPLDLLFVQQQLAGAARLVVGPAPAA